MLEVAEALAEILARVKPLAPVTHALSHSILGRVLAEDARADADSPPFNKSLRDGYAVRSADCAQPNAELRVVAEIPAGTVPSHTINAGECARIFTGAPIPDGADAVVMQEDTQPLDAERVRVTDEKVKSGQWVFLRGTEMRAGEVVLAAGTVLNAAAIGVLAGLGMTRFRLFPTPRVGIISTGNEIVEPDVPLAPGQIRNSNGPMLTAQVASTNSTPHYFGIVRDDRDSMRSTLAGWLGSMNVLLLAGGVSVGKYDLVPVVLEELGINIHFRQVRMKPGKPLLFATIGNTLVFGLPGNPVSAFVCFELFVRPALRKLSGYANPAPITTSLPLAEGIAEVNDRPTYRPAKLEAGEATWSVRPLPWLGAPDLRGLQPADALIVLQSGESRLDRGQLATVVLL
jgi:molybdopterin molybdotransferase